MTLREYIKRLKSFAAEYPEALDLEVVTSSDDEDNSYNPIVFHPSHGNLDGQDFIPYTQFDDYDLDDEDVNAVCVN